MKNDKRVQFPMTLSLELKKDFDKFCSDKFINKSQLIEWLILEYIGKENKSC